MTASILCAVLVAVAVLVEVRPARAPQRTYGSRDVAPSRGSGSRGQASRAPGWGRPGGHRERGGRRKRPEPDVAALMTEVAARLRAGAPVHQAWAHALARLEPPAGAGRDAATAVDAPTGPAPRADPRDPSDTVAAALRLLEPTARRHGCSPGLRAQVAAMGAATRLAEQLGVPLADVLDRCASGVAAAGRAETARRVALAGPTSTARLLSALPLLGVLLGVALGADPVAALLDGGVGTAAGLAGLGLLVLGHRWVSLLVVGARAAGADGPGR